MRFGKKELLVLFLFGIGVVGLFVVFSKVSPLEVLRSFKGAKPWHVFMFFFSSFLVMLLFSFRWMAILRAQGHRISVMHLLKYRICGYGIGVLTPTAKVGGEPVRMMLLKRDGVVTKEGVSSVLTDKIVEVSTNFLFFIVGLIILAIKLTIPRNEKIFIFTSIIVLGLLIFLFYYQMLRGKFFFKRVFRLLGLERVKRFAPFEKKLHDMESIMIRYHSEHKNNFYMVVFISMSGWIFTFLQLYFAFKIIGISHITLTHLFITITSVGVAFLIPIPLAIGALEAIQISSFAFMGFSSAQAVAMAFMVRSLDVFWAIIAVIILSTYGLNIMKIFKKSLVTMDEEITRINVHGTTVTIRKKKVQVPKEDSRLKVWYGRESARVREYVKKKQKEYEHRRFIRHMFRPK
ncbi:MAG: lysylphosphatidylglycerol synthase transmembrane domain-containing protein [Nanoarchaeota archaeon]